MKTFVNLISLHITFFILGTVLFVLAFRTGLFENINVFFYRGIALLTVTCALMIIFLIFYTRSSWGNIFTYRDIAFSIVLIFCLNLVFFTHLPVTADRSISVFLLGLVNKYQDKGLTKQAIIKIFTEKYLYRYEAIDKRLNEQLVSRDIEQEDGVYKITNQGKLLIRLYSIVADLFGIDKKLIFP